MLANTVVYVCPQTRMTEISSAGISGWWTVLLLLPVHLFQSNLVFLGLQQMSSERGWVLGAAAVFATQIYGWGSGSPVVRWLGCMMAGMLWTFVFAGVCIGSHKWHLVIPVNTGVGVYGITAIKNLYVAAFVLPKYCLPELYTLHTHGVMRLRFYVTHVRLCCAQVSAFVTCLRAKAVRSYAWIAEVRRKKKGN